MRPNRMIFLALLAPVAFGLGTACASNDETAAPDTANVSPGAPGSDAGGTDAVAADAPSALGPDGATPGSPFPSPVVAPPPAPPASPGPVVQVGPTRAIKTLAAASQTVPDGAIVEVDPGTYAGDVSTWTQKNVTIRGVGARPVLDANGASAGDKATFVVGSDLMIVENLEFRGARSSSNNGAGIRQEGKRLIVRGCRFFDNEDGILTGADPQRSLEIYDSEFDQNGYSDGQAHHVYAGQIGLVVAQGNWFHRAKIGHLFKSRAQESRVLYNRLTDETGTASYEIDLPNGGLAYVIGNLIEQAATTDNPAIVRMGEEGVGAWPTNELWFVNNTVVNDRSSGVMVQVAGAVGGRLTNNVFAGTGSIDVPPAVTQDHDTTAALGDLVDSATFDYRLKAAGTYADPGTAHGLYILATRQYVHPASSRALTQLPTLPGAIQP